MSNIKNFLIGVFLIFTASLSSTELVLWHGFDGYLEEIFNQIVDDFNNYSEQHHVHAIKKGGYKQVACLGLQAFEEGNPPHILQGYEVVSFTFALRPDVFVPVQTLMTKYHKFFDPDVYIDTVRLFYTNSSGQMYCFPWNASTGVLFYNKEAFEKAGLDPESPPRTWQEVEAYGTQLVQAGYQGFTTAWPVAYHLEYICALHNLPFATLDNGFKGLGSRLVFNDKVQVFHLNQLVEWQKKDIFVYSGQSVPQSENLFITEKCAILFQGANREGDLQRRAKFKIGVGFIPYWPQFTSLPHGLGVGGASFWVVSGFSEEEYKAVVQFLDYLSSTQVQAYWHQKTGYLPITEAAYLLTKKKGFYKKHKAAEIAIQEVMNGISTENTRGVRLGNYMQIREEIARNLERVFEQELSAQEALNVSVEEGNRILEQFEEEHRKN